MDIFNENTCMLRHNDLPIQILTNAISATSWGQPAVPRRDARTSRPEMRQECRWPFSAIAAADWTLLFL